ncbi:MAG: hypothetical protein KA282_02145 [Clostridia bacterium]|nr:hypothetical protein [Clostridia bacterium]
MRIESSALTMQGGSSTITATSIHEDLNVWNSRGSVSMSSSSSTIDVQEFSQKSTMVSYSATSATSSTSMKPEDMISDENELKLKLLEAILKSLSGKKVTLWNPKIHLCSDGYNRNGQANGGLRLVPPSGAGQASAGFGLIYNRSETQIEKSRVSFAAEGVVKTADGREINLNVNFNIDQEIINQSNFQLRAGDALKDPLVINFDGGLASFTNQTMSFDIDYDGALDTVQKLNSNSGYLALDNNGNGVADDGTELFGPRTDNGYGELAKYDEDGNGWIDEGDSVFDHLKIWYHDETGNSQLVALTDKNVGAIYLGSIDTKMNMYSQSGMAGALKESGLVLLENGESRIMQEIDLKI